MNIDRLIAVLPPPQNPVEKEGIPWEEIEEQIGTRLPEDYKLFITRYGSGQINNFLCIINPFSANKYINLLYQAKRKIEILKELIAAGERIPYSLYPEPNGLLPFGSTDNGDVLYWVTEGQPDDWWIVVNEARGPEYCEIKSGLGAALPQLLTKEIVCEVFPEGFILEPPRFEPISSNHV